MHTHTRIWACMVVCVRVCMLLVLAFFLALFIALSSPFAAVAHLAFINFC